MKLKYCADHADLWMAKNRENTKVLFETEHSIVILDESMPCLFISCTDLQEVEELMNHIDLKRHLTMALHQKELISNFTEWDATLKCVNLLYEKKEIPEFESPFPIRPLTENDLRQASLLYRKMEYNAYVEHCIKKGSCYGMFDGERLVAMIGEHDEEAIGLLEVDPEYRRRHLAVILESFMMKIQQLKGKMIYAQIELGNDASFCLHEKLGFTKGEETITWMRFRKRNL